MSEFKELSSFDNHYQSLKDSSPLEQVLIKRNFHARSNGIGPAVHKQVGE